MFFVFFSDGDLITIFDSSDLSFAIQCSRILKLTLFGKYRRFFILFYFLNNLTIQVVKLAGRY